MSPSPPVAVPRRASFYSGATESYTPMTSHARKLRIPSAATVFTRLLLFVFVIELLVMRLLSAWFSTLIPSIAGLIDAAIMVLLLLPPLWFMVVQPVYSGMQAAGRRVDVTPVSLLLRLLSLIFLVEFVIMVSLPVLLPDMDRINRDIIDSLLTTIVSAPLLWCMLFFVVPKSACDQPDSWSNVPVRLYFVILGAVFAIDFLLDMALKPLFYHLSGLSVNLIDAFLTMLLAAPFVWWLVVRPLRSIAQREKMHSDAIRAQVVDAIVTIDREGRIESCNRAAEEIFGYSSADLCGRLAQVLFYGDDFQLELIRGEATTGELQGNRKHREILCRSRDGRMVNMEISVSRVILDGREIFLALMRDITARTEAERALRESEQRFRQMFEQSEDAIVLFKPGSCSIIDLNPPTERLYGFTKAELLVRGLECLCGPPELVRLENFVSRIGSDEVYQLEKIINQRKDGTEIIVSVRGKVMTLQGVEIICCTFRDITERVRMEEEARNIQSRLIHTNKMTSLGLLVSGVAHEINNPNNFIMANGQFLARVWQDACKVLRTHREEYGDFLLGGIRFSEIETRVAQQFDDIVDGSRRIGEIVNNLKGFARRDPNRLGGDVDVNHSVKMALSILRHEIGRYTVNFHSDLADGLPHVRGNGNQLEQVVINLIMNACQALPAKSRSIWLSTGYDADHVTITIRDEGNGIPENVLARVFEPFFTTKLDSGGTGLGLSISSSIVKEHGGSLEFVSRQGEGTTFTVRLPAAMPADEKEHSP